MGSLFIYTRISHREQEDGYSLDNQWEKGQEKAKYFGLKPVRINEGVVTASKDDLDNRPKLKQIIEKDIPGGKIKHLYSKEITRLSRADSISNKLLEICLNNNVLLYSEGHKIDLRDPSQYFIAQLEFGLSRLESHRLGERVRDGVRRAAMNNKWPSGSLPYGYERDEDGFLVINKEEFEVVRLIFDLYVNKHLGQVRIARELNKLGYKSKTDSIWVSPSVAHILRNTLYKGKRYYKRTNEYFDCPAIISEELFDKARDIAKNKKNYHSNALKHYYLLRNLFYCKFCGSKMVGQLRKGHNNYYCISKHVSSIKKPCGMKNIHMGKVEEFVYYTVFEMFINSKLIKESTEKEVKKIDVLRKEITEKLRLNNNKIKSLEKKKDSISEMYLDEVHSKKFLKEKMEEVVAELKDNEEIMEQLKQQDSELENIKDEQSTLMRMISEEKRILHLKADKEKREFLDTLVERVELDHTGTEHILTIKFKHGLPEITKTRTELEHLVEDIKQTDMKYPQLSYMKPW
ncbi:recombinase family protein [Bacteroidota bacterium]